MLQQVLFYGLTTAHHNIDWNHLLALVWFFFFGLKNSAGRLHSQTSQRHKYFLMNFYVGVKENPFSEVTTIISSFYKYLH